jgi:hypothetical protein
MQTNKLQKPWLIFLSIVGVLIVVNIMIIIWFAYTHRPSNNHENFIAGRVSGISPDFITTQDINNVTTSFKIDDQTKYVTGRQQISKDDIKLNTLVFITPLKNSTSTKIAAEVRVLKNNDTLPNPPQN